MECILAKSAGFCFGVKRAVDKVYEEIESGKQIYTLGPIIHNDEVVKDLENKGVITLNGIDDPRIQAGETVIIRSHGVTKNIMDRLFNMGVNIIDMTCPFVKRIHDTVNKESHEGHDIIIIGNAAHPEVIGINGWVNSNSYIVETHDEAISFNGSKDASYTVVSQTTFNYNKFTELVEIFTNNGYNVNVVNTICDATRKRQEEARETAKRVDAMIVIGDKKSSNSKKLYDICSAECDNTHFIQTLKDLEIQDVNGISKIGITAGASTPNNIIEEVQNYVRNVF